jgi:5-methyltetrahydropteroyltriglutamate--homocysteine methyltransferase
MPGIPPRRCARPTSPGATLRNLVAGPFREIKKAVEACLCSKSHSSRRADWADKKSAEELASEAKKIRLGNYKTIKDAGVDIIPS